MSGLPPPIPFLIQLKCTAISQIAPVNNNNQYFATFNIPSAAYQSVFDPALGGYVDRTCTSMKVGGWITGLSAGFCWQITRIVSGTDDLIRVEIEDSENYNVYIDSAANSYVGSPQTGQTYIYFELNEDGYPIMTPTYGILLPELTQLSIDVLGRFFSRNPNRQYIEINQTSHGFLGGETIGFDSITKKYFKTNNATAPSTIGIVTSVNIPSNSWFTFKPFGTYCYDIQKFFTGIDFSAFSAGDTIYISTDGITNYTNISPGTSAVATWFYLGKDSNNLQQGILWPFIGGAGGGGGGGGNLIYDDTWFTKNLSNSAPIVPFSTVKNTSTSIYIPWNYPTQFPIGMISSWIPVISTLTCKLTFESTPGSLTTVFPVNNQASNFINFNNGVPSTFITGFVLTNQTGPSNFISTMKFPGDTFERNALIYCDPLVSSISATLGSNTFSAWYMNWNPISTVSTVSFLGYAVAGQPSEVTNLVPGVPTSSNISINVTPPTLIDSTDPATSLTIASYTANFSTIGSATRFGGPLVNSNSNTSLTLPIDISSLFPGSTYNFNIFATNSGGGVSSNSSNGTFTTPNPPAGTLGALSFPARYFSGVNRVSTNLPVTRLVNSTTNWASTPFFTPIHAAGNAGSIAPALMTLTTNITSGSVVTGPSITFDGFPATSPIANTANNITISPSVIDEYSSRGPEFQGFYLTSSNTVTLNSAVFTPFSNDIVLSGTGSNLAGSNSASFSFQYDTILSSPPTIASVTLTPPVLTNQVSGVFVLPNVPTYSISVTMGNLGNFYYSSKFLEYTITPTGTTIDEGSSLTRITAGCNAGALAPTGVICTNNSVTTGSVATFYLSNITARATVYNTFGSNSLTITTPAIVDGPSLVLKAALLNFPTLVVGSFSTGGHVSSQTWLVTNNVPNYPGPGTTPYNHATSLTVGDASSTFELQISNGLFTASSASTTFAYINYSAMHGNTVNYSGLSSGGGYRYATFAWNLPSAAFGLLTLTINGGSFTNIGGFARDSTGAKIHLSYRLEDQASKIPTNALNNSTAWLDGNSVESANIAGNYYTSSYWGGLRSFSATNTFLLVLPLLDFTGRTGILYVRIGLSLGCTNTFTGISAKVTL